MVSAFKCPLDREVFPTGLLVCARDLYHDGFTKRAAGIALPGRLERLPMTYVNQPITDVQWPSGLETLDFMIPDGTELEPSNEDINENRQYVGLDQPMGKFLPTRFEIFGLSLMHQAVTTWSHLAGRTKKVGTRYIGNLRVDRRC